MPSAADQLGLLDGVDRVADEPVDVAGGRARRRPARPRSLRPPAGSRSGRHRSRTRSGRPRRSTSFRSSARAHEVAAPRARTRAPPCRRRSSRTHPHGHPDAGCRSGRQLHQVGQHAGSFGRDRPAPRSPGSRTQGSAGDAAARSCRGCRSRDVDELLVAVEWQRGHIGRGGWASRPQLVHRWVTSRCFLAASQKSVVVIGETGAGRVMRRTPEVSRSSGRLSAQASRRSQSAVALVGHVVVVAGSFQSKQGQIRAAGELRGDGLRGRGDVVFTDADEHGHVDRCVESATDPGMIELDARPARAEVRRLRPSAASTSGGGVELDQQVRVRRYRGPAGLSRSVSWSARRRLWRRPAGSPA